MLTRVPSMPMLKVLTTFGIVSPGALIVKANVNPPAFGFFFEPPSFWTLPSTVYSLPPDWA